MKSITRPAAGNHEYKTTGAAGYFDYFNGTGVATGPAGDRDKGYYSFDVGTWHLIALNSSDHCTIVAVRRGLGAGDLAEGRPRRQPELLHARLLAPPALQLGPRRQRGRAWQPLFQALYNANADVVLGGHAHDYERFAPQNPSGELDNARGIRQFVVGTGGAFFTSIGTPKPNSQVRQNNTYGVLKLTLHPTSYDWQFVPEAGKTFTDSGTGSCHGTHAPTDRHDEAHGAREPRAPPPGPGQVALQLERVHRQRRRDRLPACTAGTTQVTSRCVHGHVLHGHRPRARHLQLHGAGDRRGGQPLRPEQRRQRHGHRHDEAQRRRAT